MFGNLLQYLLGIPFQHGARIVHVNTALRGSIGWGAFASIALVLCGLVIWMYQIAGRGISPLPRYTLAGFRVAFILLLLLLLKRPVVQLTLEGSIRQTLLVLIDGTRSMSIPERRTDDADVKRAAIARGILDPGAGLDQPLGNNAAIALAHSTRLQILQSVLLNNRLNLIHTLGNDFDITALRFGQDNAADAQLHDAGTAAGTDSKNNPVVNLQWVQALKADAPTTAIGDAIHEALERTRGQPVAGIWLITDGQNNSGASLASVAQDARSAGIPLFTYGVGLKLPRDVIVYSPFAPAIAFVDDEVPVTVRVRSQDLAGQAGRLSLKIADREVDHTDVKFGADDDAMVSMRFSPDKAGDYDLSAEIPPRPDEAIATNNHGVTHLRVVDGKIKVLFIEQSPRWEFKYLQAMLLRDRRVALKCVLIDGDPAITRGENSPYLPGIPTSREELLKYDLIILGDVDPHRFTAEQFETIGEFVSKFGGGLIGVAGRQFNPSAFAGTPLQRMLPVEISGGVTAGDAAGTAPIQLQLTDAGRRNPMARLSANDEENAQIWKDMLAPIFWDARVTRAKPAAEVLAVDPDESKASRYGNMPVIVLQQYGIGQVLYVGTDNLWRWRRNAGERFYQAFWGQAVQRLALPHLLGGSKRVQLLADKDNYGTGEKITIDARLYDKSFLPVTDTLVNGFLLDGSNERSPVVLSPMPEQPGNYRGQFVAPAPGHYRFVIDRPDDSEAIKTQLDLTVTEPRLELEETSMNETGLREAAVLSGGQFYREEDLYRLPEAIRARTQHMQSTVDAEIWCSPMYFLILTGVLIAEWILRKLCRMK
jgi:hypothetical protein